MEHKVKEKTSTTSATTFSSTRRNDEKQFGLQTLLNKVSKAEQSTVGNYYVDLGEFFTDQNEYVK